MKKAAPVLGLLFFVLCAGLCREVRNMFFIRPAGLCILPASLYRRAGRLQIPAAGTESWDAVPCVPHAGRGQCHSFLNLKPSMHPSYCSMSLASSSSACMFDFPPTMVIISFSLSAS